MVFFKELGLDFLSCKLFCDFDFGFVNGEVKWYNVGKGLV